MQRSAALLSRLAMCSLVIGGVAFLFAVERSKADSITFDVMTQSSQNVYGTNGGTLSFELDSPASNESSLFGSIEIKVTSNDSGKNGGLIDLILTGPQLSGPVDYGDLTSGAPGGPNSIFDTTKWSASVGSTDLGGSFFDVFVD